MFPGLPIQHCQFHQKKTVINYISTKPRLDASKELLNLVKNITKITKNEFSKNLNKWHKKWDNFLKEKSENILTGKKSFTHKRLRSAYFLLKGIFHIFLHISNIQN